jgi:hypothetical protein
MEVRFWAKVEKTETCWLWVGALNESGYGVVRASRARSNHLAHRWSYEQAKGPIPEGLTIDHLCRVTNCVNPEHLEAVTQAVNNFRAENGAARVRRTGCCIHGHSLSDAYIDGRGRRVCRTCTKIKNAAAVLDPKRSTYRFNRNQGAAYRHLTSEQIVQIRLLAGTMSQRQIAAKVGTSQPTVSAILSGRRY